ncbi:5-formyltetrahydrofolate cyclo-ligase [Gordonia rubripertincta]|uniref:5-formyltetrahydrofolate cyclo-ligase n=1 Tax=Gordonia rubripertincta TaxID=36822 RepID=UPI0035AF1FF2
MWITYRHNATYEEDVPIDTAKNTLRQRFRARRDVLSPQVKADADEHLVISLANTDLHDHFSASPGALIAAYVPVGTEPGSIAVLDTLLAGGWDVLLPVVVPGPPAPLEWARYSGPASLRTGRFGLLEPIGPTQAPSAVERSDVVLVPALAVDRQGVRLGRGAGYYDRSIAGVPRERLVAVVYDEELVDQLPAGPFDVPMGWALTPKTGFTRLGTT